MNLKMALSDIPSSNLSKIEYVNNDKEAKSFSLSDKGSLRVKFQNGKSYVYYDVPFSVVMDILLAESHGQMFNSKVKVHDLYKYSEV